MEGTGKQEVVMVILEKEWGKKIIKDNKDLKRFCVTKVGGGMRKEKFRYLQSQEQQRGC